MVSLGALWLPVLLSAVFVFIVSSIIHMVLKYHSADYRRLPNEEAVRAAIRSGNPPPGQYVTPHVADMKEMETPEVRQKFIEGPIALMYLRKPGPPGMGSSLVNWFLFSLVISFFVAYIASHVLDAGTEYLQVFRVVGATAFLAYAAGQVPEAIWMGKPWPVALKQVLDGLIYGLVTAGTFGWLWPR
ncbi:MAG TPA: hypothetical protein VEB59_14035 [Gemmatimonadales bacterium]|nr:hypothetical protein [Gemmatimonadales bacterium]